MEPLGGGEGCGTTWLGEVWIASLGNRSWLCLVFRVLQNRYPKIQKSGVPVGLKRHPTVCVCEAFAVPLW